MITVNLHPHRQARAPKRGKNSTGSRPRPTPKPAVLGAGFAIVLVTAFGGLFWKAEAERSTLLQRIEQAEADSARYAALADVAKTLVESREETERRIAVIRAVDEDRYHWPHIVAEIERSIPPYTWLASITSVEPGAPADSTTARSARGRAAASDTTKSKPSTPGQSIVKIEGLTGSTRALTRLMQRLEDSPYLRQVTLISSERETTDGRGVQRFVLEARSERPDPILLTTVPLDRSADHVADSR